MRAASMRAALSARCGPGRTIATIAFASVAASDRAFAMATHRAPVAPGGGVRSLSGAGADRARRVLRHNVRSRGVGVAD